MITQTEKEILVEMINAYMKYADSSYDDWELPDNQEGLQIIQSILMIDGNTNSLPSNSWRTVSSNRLMRYLLEKIEVA